MSDELKPEDRALIERALGKEAADVAFFSDTFTGDEVVRLIQATRAQGPGPGEAVDRKAAFVEGYKAAWSGRGDHTEPRREYIAKLAADAWGALAATPTREA